MDGGGDVATRAGRLFLEAVRLDLEEPGAALERARSALEVGVGGFIVFGGTLPDVAELTEALREEADRPLWLAADLERGAGQQFDGAAVLPPPAGLAAHPEPEAAARRAGEVTAREARAAGLNWVFAPVLDLDVEPENPIVGTRSFGADPEVVGRLGRAWIEACQSAGVAACAKHFPGHGRTTEDSHLAFPRVEADRETLAADLAPFRRAAGVVAGMMTAHVGYPALGGDGPATVEPAVLRGLLREEMGYEGLVITDALVMEGFGGGGEGTATEGWQAVRALRAGCDLLLYPNDLSQTARTVRQAAGQDPELAASIAAALDRSERGLERFATPPDEGGGPLSAEAEAAELARACVRATGRGPEEVLRPDAPLTLHAFSDDGGSLRGGRFGSFLEQTLSERGWRVRRAGSAEARGGVPGGQALIALEATPRAWKGRARLSETARGAVHEAAEAADAVYVLVFGHPRILASLELDGACAWSSEPALERAAADWLDARVR